MSNQAPRKQESFGRADLAPDNRAKISVVVPCHNEENNIRNLYDRICNVVDPACELQVVFVNDGSSDRTMTEIRNLSDSDSRVEFVDFSRNFGHQIAIRAGIDHADGDIVIMLDADLQHPPELIPLMIEKHHEGYDIVNMIRKDQPKASFKYATSLLFYKMANWVSATKVTPGASDFRLLSRRAANALGCSRERDVFIRGMVPTLGFAQAEIPYEPANRLHGKSNYTLKKMLRLARAGILSTTVLPLRVATYIGIGFTIILLGYLAYVMLIALFSPAAEPGWSSLMIVMLLVSSLNFMALGVMGEYIAKLVEESRQRPLYIVRSSSLDERRNLPEHKVLRGHEGKYRPRESYDDNCGKETQIEQLGADGDDQQVV
jgi:dolichol-phosphate mannosyltransferase